MSKMLHVISFLCFHGQFVANFKVSNLRLAVLIKVAFMKKSVVHSPLFSHLAESSSFSSFLRCKCLLSSASLKGVDFISKLW